MASRPTFAHFLLLLCIANTQSTFARLIPSINSNASSSLAPSSSYDLSKDVSQADSTTQLINGSGGKSPVVLPYSESILPSQVTSNSSSIAVKSTNINVATITPSSFTTSSGNSIGLQTIELGQGTSGNDLSPPGVGGNSPCISKASLDWEPNLPGESPACEPSFICSLGGNGPCTLGSIDDSGFNAHMTQAHLLPSAQPDQETITSSATAEGDSSPLTPTPAGNGQVTPPPTATQSEQDIGHGTPSAIAIPIGNGGGSQSSPIETTIDLSSTTSSVGAVEAFIQNLFGGTSSTASPPGSTPSVVTAFGQTLSVLNPTAVELGGTIFSAGGAAYSSEGKYFSVAASGQLIAAVESAPPPAAAVVNGITQNPTITPAPIAAAAGGLAKPAAVLTFDGTTYTSNSASQFIIAGQTLTPGGSITVSGTLVSEPTTGNVAIIGGTTQTLATASVAAAGGTVNSDAPSLTFDGATYTANDASSTPTFVIDGQTLTLGGTVTISGTLISEATDGRSAFLIGGGGAGPTSTQTLLGQTQVGIITGAIPTATSTSGTSNTTGPANTATGAGAGNGGAGALAFEGAASERVKGTAGWNTGIWVGICILGGMLVLR